MKIHDLLFGQPYAGCVSVDFGLAILRIATGLALCTIFEKFLPKNGNWGPQDWFVKDVAKIGFPLPLRFARCAVLSEFFGGMLLSVELLTRPRRFSMSLLPSWRPFFTTRFPPKMALLPRRSS